MARKYKYTLTYKPTLDPIYGDKKAMKARIKRLELLQEDVLGRLLPKQMDMGTVFEWDHQTEMPHPGYKECGSVGCVIGWAGHSRKFQKLGLSTNKYGDVDIASSALLYANNPDYREYPADEWGQFFGLNPHDAGSLFGSSSADGSHKQGAHQLKVQRKLLRELIRKHKEPLRLKQFR